MEDKENQDKNRVPSRIPLPLNPLPPVPKHLRIKSLEISEKEPIQTKRPPLKTLNTQVKAHTSQKPSKCRSRKPATPMRIDSKHVTTRRDYGTLDLCLKVFTQEDPDVIIISDSENHDDVQKKVEEVKKTQLMTIKGTPAVKQACLEPSRVRKIKRSLKRPHSRELQGISPSERVHKAGEDRVKRRLSFKHRISDRLQTPDPDLRKYMKCLEEYTTDMFSFLMEKEVRQIIMPRTDNRTRACVLNWLMKLNGPDGNPATIQTACRYLDLVLSKEDVIVEKLQLVAAACFWISQKMLGPPATPLNLVYCSDNAFTVEDLLVAERIILRRLNFPTQPVVANDFINYFSWWCDEKMPGQIEVAATFICLAGLLVSPILACEYPSVVAAAAVDNVLRLTKKPELLSRLMTCPFYRKATDKASDFKEVCVLQRNAVRAVGDTRCYSKYAPYEHYSVPPHFIGLHIAMAARYWVESPLDARTTDVLAD